MKYTNVQLSFINEDLFTFKNVHENFHFQSQSAQNDILIKNNQNWTFSFKIGRSVSCFNFEFLTSNENIVIFGPKISGVVFRAFGIKFSTFIFFHFRPTQKIYEISKLDQQQSDDINGDHFTCVKLISNYCSWSDWTRLAVLQPLEIDCNCLQSVEVAFKWLQLVVIECNRLDLVVTACKS